MTLHLRQYDVIMTSCARWNLYHSLENAKCNGRACLGKSSFLPKISNYKVRRFYRVKQDFHGFICCMTCVMQQMKPWKSMCHATDETMEIHVSCNHLFPQVGSVLDNYVNMLRATYLCQAIYFGDGHTVTHVARHTCHAKLVAMYKSHYYYSIQFDYLQCQKQT